MKGQVLDASTQWVYTTCIFIICHMSASYLSWYLHTWLSEPWIHIIASPLEVPLRKVLEPNLVACQLLTYPAC